MSDGLVNQQRNDEGLRELALFAGAGGGILGGHLLGWRTVAAVEYNAYARSVLLARQNDGTLPPFPVWDDVRTFDGRPWRGLVDVVSGGFPCQDISVAGPGGGLGGERSGLWSEQKRIIREVEPDRVEVENSPALTFRGLGIILGDLAGMGFDAEWGVISAANTGEPHKRRRIWIVANRHGALLQRSEVRRIPFNNWQEREKQLRAMAAALISLSSPTGAAGRISYGVAHRVDRLKAIGNGQVPRVAATAFNILSGI